ncbi:MAG TPA: sigma-70 family RNA polymerase sigma factor [Chryseosolibacter sp.]|nr:sigma-70 family RNA polymerase sigma factor [Chryseosolibacter sp.]
MDQRVLIEGIRTRDTAAIRLLVDTFQSRVLNTVISLVRNREDSEEICQDVFVEVIHSVATFRTEAALATWIYRIAINKSLDFLRMKKRKKRFAFLLSLFGEANELRHDIPDLVHPGVLMERKEDAGYFFRALDQLSDNQKTAIVLSLIEGLSYREISEVMKTSESSVESLLVRGKQNLRKTLEKYYKT